jgi:hypothetical protein
MTSYLRNLFYYFENVIHPAGGTDETGEKRKRRSKKSSDLQRSPDSSNIRGTIKKQDKARLNPAP